MAREPNDLTIRELLTQVDRVLVNTGLKRSPALFSVNDQPKTLVDNAFALDLQTSDTQLFREGGEESARVTHQLTVSVLKQVRPMAQFDSLCAAGDIEERVMAAMLKRSNLPFVVVRWTQTQRTPSDSREYLVLAMTFALEHDWSWSQLQA
jgi:hypothetical protein